MSPSSTRPWASTRPAPGQHPASTRPAPGQHPATIYGALYSVFKVHYYQELLEAQWEQVERWFQVQLGRKEEHF